MENTAFWSTAVDRSYIYASLLSCHSNFQCNAIPSSQTAEVPFFLKAVSLYLAKYQGPFTSCSLLSDLCSAASCISAVANLLAINFSPVFSISDFLFFYVRKEMSLLLKHSWNLGNLGNFPVLKSGD